MEPVAIDHLELVVLGGCPGCAFLRQVLHARAGTIRRNLSLSLAVDAQEHHFSRSNQSVGMVERSSIGVVGRGVLVASRPLARL